MGSAHSNLSFGSNSLYNTTLVPICVVLFVPFCCGYEQIIQFCSRIDRCVRIETGKARNVAGWEERGESVSWEKSRSMIQLCARQEGKEEEKKTEELREGRREKRRLQEEEEKNAVNT